MKDTVMLISNLFEHIVKTHVFSVMLERKNFPQKALFITDRGYESYLLMAQIQHDGNYFPDPVQEKILDRAV